MELYQGHLNRSMGRDLACQRAKMAYLFRATENRPHDRESTSFDTAVRTGTIIVYEFLSDGASIMVLQL